MSFIPESDGLFLLTGKDCPVKFSHNDFAVQKAGGWGFFVIVNGNSGIILWLRQSSHKYIFYGDETKRQMSDMLKLEEVHIPPHSVSVGHGYLQHTGPGWTGSDNIRYHMYIVPQDYDLPDAVKFAYLNSFHMEVLEKNAIKETKNVSVTIYYA